MEDSKTCGNCKHWKRYEPRATPIYDRDNNELDTQRALFGDCDMKAGLTEIGFHDRLKGNEIIIHADMYDIETGENFGCIHFEGAR